MSQDTAQVNVVRLSELDTATPDILLDPTKIIWGLVEVEGKVYKYNIRDYAAQAAGNDPRVPALITKVDKLTEQVNAAIGGFDENVVLAP